MNTIELVKNKNNQGDFARLKAVLACTSNDETRYVLSKLLVEKNETGINIIATDGRRLRCDSFNLEAEAGLYEVKSNTGKNIFLTECTEELVFPNYRQVIPAIDTEQSYELHGTGKQFVLWATAALGCWLDPKLVQLGDDEEVALYIHKSSPAHSPALLANETTTLVVMPLRVDQPWIDEIEAIQRIITREAIEAQMKDAEALAA